MKDTKKPQYSITQNTVYSAKLAWKFSKLLLAFTPASSLLSLVTGLIQLYIAPVILRKVEQSVPLWELLLTILLFTLALTVCNALTAYFKGEPQYVGVRRLLHGVCKVIIRRTCTTSYANLLDTKFREAEIAGINAALNDSSSLAKILTQASSLVISLLGFGLYLAVLRKLPPLLLAVIAFTAAVSFFLGRRCDEKNYEAKEESRQLVNRNLYITNLVMANEMPKDIRIFGMQDWLDDVWNSTMALWRSFCNRKERRLFWVKAADALLSFGRNGIAYLYLIQMVLQKGLSASDFLLYFSAVTGFTGWITTILNSVAGLNKTSLEICGFREMMEWPEPFRFDEGKPVHKEDFDRYELRLENVSYRYPGSEKDTISHMNLTIRPGEKVAIVGLNGAGKTTLIKLLCGFLDPTQGRVLLNGQDIREFNRKDYYTLFTAVFQDFSRLQISIAQNVAQSVSNIDRERLNDCVEKAGLKDALSELPKGLDTMLGKIMNDDGVELSGGQLQKLMLARALYKDAPILLLDEPTAALDPIAENEIYQRYSEMTRGRTSVYISHRLASTRFCDRILFLENGNIAEEGTHDALMALGGGYCKLFQVQSKYYQEGAEEHENQLA